MFSEEFIFNIIDEEVSDYIKSIATGSFKVDNLQESLVSEFANNLKSKIHFAVRKNGNTMADSLGEIDDIDYVENEQDVLLEDDVANEPVTSEAEEKLAEETDDITVYGSNGEILYTGIALCKIDKHNKEEPVEEKIPENASIPDEEEMEEPLEEIDNSAYYVETNEDGALTSNGIVMLFCDFLANDAGYITDFKKIPLKDVLQAITECGMWEAVVRVSENTRFSNAILTASSLCSMDDSVDYNYVVSEMIY